MKTVPRTYSTLARSKKKYIYHFVFVFVSRCDLSRHDGYRRVVPSRGLRGLHGGLRAAQSSGNRR